MTELETFDIARDETLMLDGVFRYPSPLPETTKPATILAEAKAKVKVEDAAVAAKEQEIVDIDKFIRKAETVAVQAKAEAKVAKVKKLVATDPTSTIEAAKEEAVATATQTIAEAKIKDARAKKIEIKDEKATMEAKKVKAVENVKVAEKAVEEMKKQVADAAQTDAVVAKKIVKKVEETSMKLALESTAATSANSTTIGFCFFDDPSKADNKILAVCKAPNNTCPTKFDSTSCIQVAVVDANITTDTLKKMW